MMTVYTLLIDDRHSDPGIKVYARSEDAIRDGRSFADEYWRHGYTVRLPNEKAGEMLSLYAVDCGQIIVQKQQVV